MNARGMGILSSLLTMAIVMSFTVLSAAENNDPRDAAPLLAKMSYQENGIVEQNGKSMPNADICIAVWQDGHYQLLNHGEADSASFLQGTMSEAQLKQLTLLLDTPDFLALTDARGDFVRKEFIAEVYRQGKTQHVVWVIPDSKQRFPKSAAEIVDWLLKFNLNSVGRLTRTGYTNVCPSPNVSPFVPVAENLGFAINESCVR